MKNKKIKILFIYPYFDKLDKSFHALFIGKTDKKIISELKWISLNALKKDIQKNAKKYVPHMVFGLKKYFKEISLP